MTYVDENCLPIAEVKTQIKDGYYEELKNITEVKLYRNDKRQWRIKMKLENETKTQFKNINLLATVIGSDIFINKKSLEYSAQSLMKDDDISDIAEKFLLN
jgi:hypothetical protein